MNTVETIVSFEAAHRLYDVDTYSTECRDNIHGHSYKVKVVVGSENLNSAGMVVDFKKLKVVVKERIEDVYDHSCILRSTDPLVPAIRKECKKVIVVDESPTAEWMAKHYFALLTEDSRLDGIDILSVSVQETENNIATYSIGGKCRCK